MDDVGKAVTVSISMIFLLLLFSIVVRSGNGIMDYQGKPSNWDSFNGYKVAGSFLVSNYDNEFGRLDEETATQLINEGNQETSSNVCSFNLPGFKDQGGFLEGRKSETRTCKISNDRNTILRLYSGESNPNYYSIKVGGEE